MHSKVRVRLFGAASSLEHACVETICRPQQTGHLSSHRLSALALKSLCVKSSVIKRETSGFAIDPQSCTITLHINKFQRETSQVMSRQASIF